MTCAKNSIQRLFSIPKKTEVFLRLIKCHQPQTAFYVIHELIENNKSDDYFICETFDDVGNISLKKMFSSVLRFFLCGQ